MPSEANDREADDRAIVAKAAWLTFIVFARQPEWLLVIRIGPPTNTDPVHWIGVSPDTGRLFKAEPPRRPR